MIHQLKLPSPLQKLTLQERPDLQFYIKRDDLIHHSISGNKYRKLQGLLQNKKGSYSSIVTFGGAFSNHIVATASICHLMKIPCCAYIRTENIDHDNPTLRFCKSQGMILYSMDREKYRNKENDEVLLSIQKKHPQSLIIGEGGSSIYSAYGMQVMLDEIKLQLNEMVDFYVCSLGTGATSSGILSNMEEETSIIICPAIKGVTRRSFTKIHSELGHALSENFTICYAQNQKSYAKKDLKLFQFIEQFYKDYDVLLDPIYTGKAMYAFLENATNIPKNSKVVFIHTGGIQAWKGYFYRFPALINELPLVSQLVLR